MLARLSSLHHAFVLEPYLWLQSCFFQPVRFKHDFENAGLSRRLLMMLRLVPILFLYTYTPALVVRIFIYIIRPDLYPSYMIHSFVPLSPNIIQFLFDVTWATAVSCLLMGLIAGLFNLRFGIAGALAAGLANGIIVNTSSDILVGIIFGLAFGLALGIAFNSAHSLKEGGLKDATIASALGILAGMAIGYFTGTIGGYWSGFWLAATIPWLEAHFIIAGSIIGLFVGGTAGCLLAALLGRIMQDAIKGKEQLTALGMKISIAVAGTFGITIGIPVGDSGFNAETFASGLFGATSEIAIVGTIFLLLYVISYYRLPLYPISAYSALQAYLASKLQPQRTLYCLHHCSLHWDECVFLPLPYLREMLLLASEESLDGTLEELRFILEKRPQQRSAALAVAYELALRDLEWRTSLRDIGQAHKKLTSLLPREMRSVSASAERVFRSLDDASREAASSYAQTDKILRQEALERMLRSLQAIQLHAVFGRVALNQQLNLVVKQWRMLAEQGKDMLQSLSGSLYIENPYVPGSPMEVGDPLFMGRDDILQKLGQALQQKYRSTFLLTGERRMGKSSILKQLPVLLGPRYIPVFYDLQTTGMISSTAAFFATIAANIEKHLMARGLAVQSLTRSQLDAAQQQDEIKVYDVVEQWYAEVEQTIEQGDRTLLLMFDEFEMLEVAEARGTINLHLLFNWFRSVIQNRSRLVLLFSGAKMVGDMGRSWAGYFVNVERIKVSFLREADAYNLVVHPVPHLFNEEVAKEIIHITHSHPFLIQALCKHTLEILIDENRTQATSADVASAAEEVFDSWSVYFWDLWDRCDQDQCSILLALFVLRTGETDQIVTRTNLGRQSVQRTLEKLQIRDLVIREGSVYQFAIPLFAQWIEQNQYLLTPSSES
jgi:hypothetical protein